MNSLAVIGFISTDITLDVTPNNGKYVATFGLAITNPFNRNKTSFVDVEIWNKAAESIAEHCSKGSKVGLTGYLEVRTWKEDGKIRKRPYMVAQLADYLSYKNQKDKIDINDLNTVDISDDDLPF